MFIYVHEDNKTFHLQNDEISYVMHVLPSGQMGQLYFGKRIHDRENFDHLLEGALRSHSAYPQDGDNGISPEHVKHEYPSFGTGDFRQGAVEILQKNGSRMSRFKYAGYEILPGKPKLAGLPESVITRAKAVLKDLENGKKTERPKKKKKEVIEDEPAQMSLIEPQNSVVSDFVRDIDVNTLTPIEALNKLYELKRLCES